MGVSTHATSPARQSRRGLRRLVVVLVALPVVAVSSVLAVLALLWFALPVSTIGEVEFAQPLAVPPLAESHVDARGRRVFELTAQAGTAELLPGERVESWGFNGAYLGPTLRASRGEEVMVKVTNDLDEATSVHWHGMHLPPEADGGPHQPVELGGTWQPSWRIDQPAATLWYHPHPHGETEAHVARGLAGMFILDEPGSAVGEALPHQYGVDDVPVIVQDKKVDGGKIQTDPLGGDLLVNGTYGPYLEVSTERLRLRLLNASTKRVFDFGFSDNRAFMLIGTDGGLLPESDRRDRVLLSPGERAEIVVDMAAGEDVMLRSYAPDLESNLLAERFGGGADEFDVLELRARDELVASPVVPQKLAPAPDLETEDAVTREFVLRGREINDKRMDMSRIDETVELNTTEIWEVHNADGEYHNFHVHDVQFQVLDVDGRGPGAELSGWKDTIFMPPGRTVRLAMHFTDYADPDTPYMYHCHLLQHEDNGMMGQFVVVEKGEEARTPAHRHH
jgi:FtsP/CotA-like multicopper oxidase with cupredoxin domain